MLIKPVTLHILILLGLFIPISVSGSHLAGGELTYQCLGKNANGLNRYRITCTLYRDCSSSSNVNFDSQISLYAYRVSDGGLTDSLVITSFVADLVTLGLNDTCAELPPGLCYERGRYSGILDLPDNNFGYDLSWARCCRNASVVNMVNPGITGTTLTVRIPPTALCDNSPVFQQDPGMALCLGLPYAALSGATDPDGDSISFHLLTPYQGGSTSDPIPVPTPPPYNPINWNPPYNLSNILGGSPGLTLDATTGSITATPDVNGQFAVCVAARSWRNGQMLTEIRRDFQMNVVTCLADIAPVVAPPAGPLVNGKELTFYAGRENCYSFNISDAADNFVVFTASGEMFNPPTGTPASYNGAGYGNIMGRLCWSPDCSLAGYTGTVIISSNDNNNCPAPNYTFDTFSVKVIPPEIQSADLRCVYFEDGGSVKLEWITPEPVPGFRRYEIWRSTTLLPEQVIHTISDSTLKTWTDPAPGNPDEGISYRIQTIFDCPSENPAVPSDALTLLKPTISQSNPVTANISWAPYTGWENPGFRLTGQPGNILVADTAFGLSFTWDNCDFEGYVQMDGRDPISGCLVRSAPSDTFRMYLDPPGKPQGCTASVLMDNTGVVVQWVSLPVMDGFVPVLSRKNPNTENFTEVSMLSPSVNSFTDYSAKPDEGMVEYRIGFVNPCGLSGDWSDTFGTFHLQVLKQSGEFVLNWSPAYILEGVSEYEVQIRETENLQSPWLVMNRMAADQERVHRDNQILTTRENYCYRIRAYPIPGACALETWSNTDCERPEPSIAVPGAFSPNGDGLNDFYRIPVFAIRNFSLQIYDRWGTLVFQTSDPYFTWDGNRQGNACPEGVYAFILTAEGHSGQSIRKNGTITLIR